MNDGEYEWLDIDSTWSDRIPWPLRTAAWKARLWLRETAVAAWWATLLSMRPKTLFTLHDAGDRFVYSPGQLVSMRGIVYRIARIRRDGVLVCVAAVWP